MTLTDFYQYTRYYKANLNSVKKENWIKYHRIFCGFDIETTSQNEKAFMYIWQFSYMTDTQKCVVVKGRHWHEFIQLLEFLKKRFALRESTRIIIWVANLGYEFAFMRKYLNITKVFAKTNRNPLIVECNGIEFRDCLAISQGNLEYLATNWTTTKKMVGDLDYNIKRNSKTKLTEKEEKYCDNDVIILAEFSKVIFDNYIATERYVPITSTGILRHDLKKRAKQSEKDTKRLYEYIKALYPKSKADYIYIMTWLFRGGFVHSNHLFTNIECNNMDSFDFKSSYPASAFQEYFPMSDFRPIENVSRETLEELCENYCVIFQATFYNVKATTTHSIESKSKCISVVKPILDNGRIFECEKMTVFLTELDYQSYKEFYTWEEELTEIHSCNIAIRGKLPKYLLDSFYYWFDKKESIKDKESQEYAITKTRINGHFGLCVTKLCFDDVVYINDEWTKQEVNKTYDDLISKEVLSPYWGIYITAHSRRKELMLLYKLKDYVVYSDTDSHKCFVNETVKQVVNDYNERIEEINKKVCCEFGYDYNILKNIGKFECETKNHKITRFKTLGAKRYVCIYDDGAETATISGLPKKSLEKYCESNNLDIIDIFNNDLVIDKEYTNKLVSMYCDEPYEEVITDNQGHTELMKEKSGIYLRPSDYDLNVDKNYLELLIFWLERIEKYGY